MDNDPARTDAAFTHCEALLRQRDMDRFLASLFAPADARPLLHALYAFDAEVADVAGRVREPMAGELRLQWWRDVVEGGRDEEAKAAPVAAAVRSAMVRRKLPAELFLRHLEAHAFDLYDDPMPTLTALERYAMDTAGSILQLAALVLGDKPFEGDLLRHAALAITVTRCLRELARDVSQGRLFIPLDVLDRHGADTNDMAAGHATAGVKAALAELAALGRHHHGEAARLTAGAPANARPALLPLALVPLYLDRVERDDDPFRRTNSVPQWQRQWRLWRAARAMPRNG